MGVFHSTTIIHFGKTHSIRALIERLRMNSGRQKKTTLKYLLYLYALCKRQNIADKCWLNIKNFDLMRQFKISATDSDFHEHLEDLDIIECVDEHYFFDFGSSNNGERKESRTKKYSINLGNYIAKLRELLYLYPQVVEKLEQIDELQQTTERYRKYKHLLDFDKLLQKDNLINVRKVEDDAEIQDFIAEDIIRIMSTNSITSQFDIYAETDNPKDSSYTVASTDVESLPRLQHIFEQFQIAPGEYDDFFSTKQNIDIGTAELTSDDWAKIESAYKDCVKSTRLFGYLIDITKKLSELDYIVHLRANIKIDKHKRSFSISCSGRQNNLLCKMEKTERETVLASEGYDSQFDIHSSCYAITRLMNFGVFDADWDAKAELLNNNDYLLSDGSKLTREQLKTLSYRMFYSKSVDDSYSKYVNSYKGYSFGSRKIKTEKEKEKIKNTPIMDKETFSRLLQDCQSLIGGSSKYYYSLFFVESLFECRVIYEMLMKGYDVKNVYDCFYYKSSQTTEEEVKAIINECAHSVYKDLTKKSLFL